MKAWPTLVCLGLLVLLLAATADAKRKPKPKRQKPGYRPKPKVKPRHHAVQCRPNTLDNKYTESLERNISLLWKHIELMSRPINVHIHGGEGDEYQGHGGHGGHGSHGHKGHKVHTPKGKTHREHSHGGQGHGRRTPGKSKGHKHGSPKTGHSGARGHQGHADGNTTDGYHHGNHGYGCKGSQDTNIHVYIKMAGDNARDYDHSHEKHHKEKTEEEEYAYASCNLSRVNDLQDRVKRMYVKSLQGHIQMREKRGQPMEVKVNISGMSRAFFGASSQRMSGLHVHTYSGLEGQCWSFGGHYNPHNTSHGVHSNDSHVGDWGNLEFNWTDEFGGVSESYFNSSHSTLFGRHSVVGRGIVLHESEDDHGKGGTSASQSSGNAGARISCCTIRLVQADPNSW